MAFLLDSLRDASDQAAALAARAAAHAPLDDLISVAILLGSLREAGAHDQAAALASRAAAHAPLDKPHAVAELLDSLRWAGAHDQAAALASRAAAHIPLDELEAPYLPQVGRLRSLNRLRLARGHAALAERIRHPSRFELFLAEQGSADQFRFGREADDTPAAPWSWEDLDLWFVLDMAQRRNRKDDLNNPRSNCSGRRFEAQLAGGVVRRDQLNGTIKELVIGLRTERLVGDDQGRFPDDLQRGFARRSNLVGMATAWVIRSGKYGERDSWALKHGCSGGGWAEVPDLTNVTTREQVAQIVIDTYPGPDALIANYTGQLWALRGRVQPGDLLVMPMKTTKQIAIGRVTEGYEYLATEEDPNCRHVVRVDWQRRDLPRTAAKQDLLFTLGSAMSVFAPSKNNAVTRLEHLLDHGTDPGQVPAAGNAGSKRAIPAAKDEAEAVDEPELTTDIEEVAYDRITARISEDFAGHNLATLVTAILETDGLKCTQSPPGPDGGIDIIAGRGVLGLDNLILVQVKSGAQVGSPVVNQLHGVMATHGADQGLLVAWGGLTKQAQDQVQNHKLRVRVWQAADVVDAVLSNYERLPAEIRTALPLKQVWMIQDT